MPRLFLTFFCFVMTFGGSFGRALASPEDQGPEIFVLALANAESFDRSLPTLRYAGDDLTRFLRALARMDGVPEDHVVVQRDASLASVRRAFAAITAKIAA